MVSKLKLNEQKRQHRERAQPAHRKKLGHLEKHQDYVKRARDFHSKEDRIQKLREKASFRNKDEFYFGMIKSKTKKGIHVQSRGNEPLPTDLVKALKTQDATYIRMQATMEQGRVRKLKEELAALVDNALPKNEAPGVNAGQANDDDDMFMDDWDMYDDGPVASTSAGPKRNHVVFTDSIEAVRQADVSSILQKRTTPTALPAAFATDATADSTSKRRKGKGKAALADAEAARAEYEAVSAQIASEAAAHRTKLEQTLAAREERLAQLLRAARELELQRHMMGKGKKEQVVRAKGDKGAQDDDWWMQGVKGAKKSAAEENEGKLPMAGEGVATGARVWKFKTQRKR
ncbi:hypothetical protein BMF94_3193 [Rhodotorula taiwanensis]|uniref:U3 small nucleolar RNA-associated protein 11 n=1 Tax=Rhodotorula taiwanensis TaxID=741276 RepID=A0A2S5BA65_9BASI|nr:hypothetical protein BMF94_3193 [Rhodotorula taiwanensis]